LPLGLALGFECGLLLSGALLLARGGRFFPGGLTLGFERGLLLRFAGGGARLFPGLLGGRSLYGSLLLGLLLSGPLLGQGSTLGGELGLPLGLRGRGLLLSGALGGALLGGALGGALLGQGSTLGGGLLGGLPSEPGLARLLGLDSRLKLAVQ
jgi:hypothetical protein